MEKKRLGRPRLYELPTFEKYLKEVAEVRYMLGRDYIRCVCQMLAFFKKNALHTPNADDVIEAFDSLPPYTADVARAGWNHYCAHMKKSEGHYLPPLDRRIPKKTAALSEEQKVRRGALKLFAEHTGCTLTEMVGLNLRQVRRFRPKDPRSTEVLYALNLFDPQRTIRLLLNKKDEGHVSSKFIMYLNKCFHEAFRCVRDFRDSRRVYVFGLGMNGFQAKPDEIFDLLRTGVIATSLRHSAQPPIITQTSIVKTADFYQSRVDQAIHRFLNDEMLSWEYVEKMEDGERDEAAKIRSQLRLEPEQAAMLVDDWDDLFS